MLRKFGYAIIRLILLIRNYGMNTGIRIWLDIFLSFSKKINIHTSYFNNPVILRKKDSDLDIFDQVFTERQYKWFGIETLNPSVIIDAGANIGLSSLYFSKQFPDAKIFCIEPDPENYKLLQMNTAGYPNIQTLQGAIWYQKEKLEVLNPEGFSAGLALQKGSFDSSIQGYSIEAIMDHFGLKNIDIIKMDIEGAEKEIFEYGNTSWLDITQILVIELHDMYKEGTAKAFFNAIHNRFEKIYIQGENIICYLKKEII